MKPSTLLLSAVIALGAAVSGNALADGDYGRGHGWGDHGRHGYYQERHHRSHPRYRRHHHKHHHEHYVYVPRAYPYRGVPHHSDGWYGIQLFLGGDL